MRVLTRHTAQRIRELARLQAGTGGGRRPDDPPARRVVVVRCTSAAAAGAAGVEAQCYPGVIVDPAADAAAQDELADPVWLTVLEGAGAAAPAVDATYLCLLAGDVTAGGDTRARAFGVAAVEDDPDATPAVRGYVSTGTQTFGGAKTFTSSVTVASLASTAGITAATSISAGAGISGASVAATGNVTAGGTVSGDSLSGNSLAVTGNAVVSGDLSADGATFNTIDCPSIATEAIGFPPSGLNNRGIQILNPGDDGKLYITAMGGLHITGSVNIDGGLLVQGLAGDLTGYFLTDGGFLDGGSF